MKIHLLQATRKTFCRTNKDTNGGYGTLNDFGDSLTSRLLTLYKKMAMNFLELSPAYASAILKSQGHEVTYGENTVKSNADITLMQSSLVHFNEERRWAKEIKTRYPSMRVGFFGGVSNILFDQLLESADFVISGEVENALVTGDITTFDVSLNPYGAQFTVATPYPGTPWFDELMRDNHRFQLSANYDDYTQYQLVYKHPHLSSDTLTRLKNKAYRKFYYRMTYIRKHHLPLPS